MMGKILPKMRPQTGGSFFADDGQKLRLNKSVIEVTANQTIKLGMLPSPQALKKNFA